jgi:gamma-glutamyl-gamma-aminobutyrate hydrolase PuuD
VAKAGGVPLLIPPTADASAVVPLLDGFLIPGGRDIDATRWGEANHPEVEPQDPARFEIEAEIYRLASPNLPIFGICYGCQFLNVVRGGTLIQHLPDVVGHGEHTNGTLQEYALDPTSRLAQETTAERVAGKSFHHQAVGRLGQGLRVTAHAPDGTVEAIEATDRAWAIGVQWHPERTPEDPATQELFRAFIRAARTFRESKGLHAAAA